LTVYKIQDLTLPEIFLFLDDQIFLVGQAYVALSRCSNWLNIYIFSLNPSAFIVNQSMIKKYKRLE